MTEPTGQTSNMSNDVGNATGARKPSEKEAYFFLTILASMKNKPEVDWDLVATRAGYSNGPCAKTRFGQIKRQIGLKEDGSIGVPTPVKSRAKKEKTVGSGTKTSPSKVEKKKSTPRKPKATKVLKDEDEDVAGVEKSTKDVPKDAEMDGAFEYAAALLQQRENGGDEFDDADYDY